MLTGDGGTIHSQSTDSIDTLPALPALKPSLKKFFEESGLLSETGKIQNLKRVKVQNVCFFCGDYSSIYNILPDKNFLLFSIRMLSLPLPFFLIGATT